VSRTSVVRKHGGGLIRVHAVRTACRLRGPVGTMRQEVEVEDMEGEGEGALAQRGRAKTPWHAASAPSHSPLTSEAIPSPPTSAPSRGKLPEPL